MNKLIITCALCGAGTKKSMTPYVPVTPEEIAVSIAGELILVRAERRM